MSSSLVEQAAGLDARSGGRRRGSIAGLAALVVGFVLVGIASLMVGNQVIAPWRVVSVLFEHDGSAAAVIVHGLRLPRTALLLMVGLGLGASGALMQGYTRNPLADPGLLGISSGAALAVVLGIYAFGVTSPAGYAWFAMAGSGVAAWLVFVIGSTKGGPNPTTLVLAGAAVSALAAAITTAIITSSATTLDDYRFWAVGSATGRGMEVFWQLLPFVVVGLVLAAAASIGLNLLQLGDDVAASLGLHPSRQKTLGVLAIMLLCGGAVAACGPIGFVGLVVPPLARFIAGVDYRWVVPYAALLGAMVTTVADIIGRVIAGGSELQVGIVMALIGGPAFVLLVRRRRALSI